MSILLYKFSAGDYRVILVDFNIYELTGWRVKVCSISIRWLICKNQLAIDNYNFRAVEFIKFCDIKEYLDNIKLLWDSTDEDLRTVRIDILDKQVTRILLNAEKGYRKLRIGKVEYSLEVSNAVET